MSKVIKLENSKEVLGKNIEVMDTPDNCEKAAEVLKKVYDVLSKLDDEANKKNSKVTEFDYINGLRKATIEQAAKFLNLSDTEKKKLKENGSFSDIEAFLAKVSHEFVGLELPTVTRMTTAMADINENGAQEDPKDSTEK